MIVMKFGGISIADDLSIKRMMEIVKKRLHLNPVLIFSAMGKTTRNLLDAAETAPNQLKKANEKLDKLFKYHQVLIRTLMLKQDKESLLAALETYKTELIRLMDLIEMKKKVEYSIRDQFLAYGEIISSRILSCYLNDHDIPVQWLDARKMIITDNRFTEANPIEDMTETNIREILMPVIESGRIPVVQGFIGSTQTGETTTLGFEGSDFTAALVGSALNVSEIQLWKDVPGLMTADPVLVKDAVLVNHITYEEATELTRAGAKILHPKTMNPAQKKYISIHICNTKEPDAKGTIIDQNKATPVNTVISITYRYDLTGIELEPKGKMTETDFLSAVFTLMDRHHIHPLIFKNEENRISMLVPASGAQESFVEALRKKAGLRFFENQAALSLIGEDLEFEEEQIRRLFQKIDSRLYQSTPHQLMFSVHRDRIPVLLNDIHKLLFKSNLPVS